MSKPVGLIVANRIHDTASRFGALSAEKAAGVDREALRMSIARTILCDISHEAALPKVLAALAAADGPSTLDEIDQRIAAALDLQRAEAGQTRPSPGSEAVAGQSKEPGQ